MKLMKHITIALVLCAIPAMAFGQTVSCDDCTHEVSVYMGGGGLIATADDADMVSYVASCGGSARFGELAANDDDVVSMLFEPCLSEGGSFKIGPIMDGGWYWITDDMNSAVGNLVAMDILDNDTVDITDAGDSVEMEMGKGAVYLKHTASGRVGILPNILPEPPVEALRLCGADDKGTTGTSATAVANEAGARFVRRTSKCALGDGGTITLATTTNTQTGAISRVMDKASIVRPAGTGEVVITVDLWANGSGHFTTAADGHALLGNPVVSMGALRSVARLTGVSYSAGLGTGPNAAPLADGTAAAGITMDSSTTTNVVTFTIAADTTRCSATNNYPVTVSVTAEMTSAGDAAQTTPARSRNATSGAVGSTSFTVGCGSASSSANMGQELVPDNPFPTDK